MLRMKILLSVVLIMVIIVGCSRWDMLRLARIAATGDVASAGHMAAQKVAGYAVDPKSLERDVRSFSQEFDSLLKGLKEAVSGVWGKEEVKAPGPKEYVKYTRNYHSRVSVDFDRGVITVETLARKEPLEALRNAIVTSLLTPEDPRSVDMFSDREVEINGTPFLYGEVRDHEGKYIRWPWRAGHFADYLIRHSLNTRKLAGGRVGEVVRYVNIPMVPDHSFVSAKRYRPFVEHFSRQFFVPRNLIYAIIKTESDFNPYAVSDAPAFGLMQIVPQTAGLDVNRFLNNVPRIPSRGFLFKPENNIQYGTAYLHLLDNRYLKDISDSLSREYCVIAAYNTGAGNVLRTFHRNEDQAFRLINGLGPLEVLTFLKSNLPHREARRYLTKVMSAQKDFVAF